MTVPQPGPRAVRKCDHCQQEDDKGHHQVVVPEQTGLVTVSRHFACCDANGCPDGSCAQILNRSTSGV